MPPTSDFHSRWALITGASSGIGTALARELAARGAKLILTARRRDRLHALAAELAAMGTETRVIVADLNDPAAPQQIFDVTEGSGLAVDILVNNAGLGLYGAFIANDSAHELSQVRVNCEAVVHLSRLFVPRMVERRRLSELQQERQLSAMPPVVVGGALVIPESMLALLDTVPRPDDSDIDAAMAGNICRCGTYVRIRQAIKRAAAEA